MSWDLRFPEPIPVPGGKPLVTLQDAGVYISALPKTLHETPPWQSAMFVLLHAAERGGPIEFARLGIEQALRPKPKLVYHSPSKDPKWRNNYKLVREQ